MQPKIMHNMKFKINFNILRQIIERIFENDPLQVSSDVILNDYLSI